MLTRALCLLAGIVSALALPVMPAPAIGVAAVALGWIAGVSRLVRPLRWWLVGFGLAILDAGATLGDRLPPDVAGRDRLLVGEVEAVLSDQLRRTAFFFAPEDPGRGRSVPRRLRLVWYDPPVVPAAGEKWRLMVRLRPPRGTANPHGFDYERWLLARRVGATGYVRGSTRNARLAEAGGVMARARSRIAMAIRLHLGDDDASYLLRALVTGDRAGLSRDTRDRLLETGTAHLLAISGLHVGIAAGTGAAVGRAIARMPGSLLQVSGSGMGWIGAIVAATVYSALVGPTVSTRRALAMVVLVCIAGAWRRTSALPRGLCLAAVIVLLSDPLSPLDGGFWLSFGAVSVLATAFAGRVMPPGRFAGFLGAQYCLAVGMVVPALALFGFLSVAAPATNLLAVPLVALVVLPAGFVGAGLSLVDPVLSGAPFRLADLGLEALLELVRLVAAHGPAVMRPAAAHPLALACGLAGSGLLLAPRACPGRRVGPVLLAPLLAWQGPVPANGDFDLVVLDVGQGLSAIVRTREHALVYDAGPAWPGGDAALLTVRPFLASQGVRRLDAMVISHGDNDHAGGAETLLDQVAGPVISGGGTTIRAGHTRGCFSGQAWEWDGVRFQFLHPPRGAQETDNDSSCVLRVWSRSGSALLPGDISARAERSLLSAGADVAADVVVAAHHGSATSSAPAFVRAVRADWVVYAAGYGNRWGFPRPEVEARWRTAGARAVDTGAGGAVTFRFRANGNGPFVESYRCVARRFWRARSCQGTVAE